MNKRLTASALLLADFVKSADRLERWHDLAQQAGTSKNYLVADKNFQGKASTGRTMEKLRQELMSGVDPRWGQVAAYNLDRNVSEITPRIANTRGGDALSNIINNVRGYLPVGAVRDELGDKAPGFLKAPLNLGKALNTLVKVDTKGHPGLETELPIDMRGRRPWVNLDSGTRTATGTVPLRLRTDNDTLRWNADAHGAVGAQLESPIKRYPGLTPYVNVSSSRGQDPVYGGGITYERTLRNPVTERAYLSQKIDNAMNRFRDRPTSDPRRPGGVKLLANIGANTTRLRPGTNPFASLSIEGRW